MENGSFEDIFPIENGDIPACYVSLPLGSSCEFARCVFFFPGVNVLPSKLRTVSQPPGGFKTSHFFTCGEEYPPSMMNISSSHRVENGPLIHQN